MIPQDVPPPTIKERLLFLLIAVFVCGNVLLWGLLVPYTSAWGAGIGLSATLFGAAYVADRWWGSGGFAEFIDRFGLVLFILGALGSGLLWLLS